MALYHNFKEGCMKKVLAVFVFLCVVALSNTFGQMVSIVCDTCKGTGKSMMCPACAGSGVYRVLDVRMKCPGCNGVGQLCPMCNSTGKQTVTAQYAAEQAFNRGETAYNEKKYDVAITEFTEAIRLNPNHEPAYSYRAGLYLIIKKDYDRAIADLEAALRIRPNSAYNKGLLESARELRNQ